jgi:2-polyprenyl-6-methoxyphenol hydroxylase-like FAD-dependent oxidoreductase
MRIAIVGYGTGGQAAAIFLARDGHDVEVFERSDVLKPVGAGFLLQPTGLSVLTALGSGCTARTRRIAWSWTCATPTTRPTASASA